MNMKRYIIMILGIVVPLLVMAQGAGGEIRRPTRTNTNSNTQNRPVSNSQRPTNNANLNNSAQSVPRSRDVIIQELINNMVLVGTGTYTMGATIEQKLDEWANETPAHQVTIASFYINKYEVTQEEWQAVMGNNPASFTGLKHPVEQVSWNDSQEFLKKLNSLTGRNFRLPTEAEWEYAARGGNRSNGTKYSGSENLNDVAWYNDNSNGATHDVGTKQPNELGLYDFCGNVREWCQDRFGSYNSYSQINPKGASSGSNRVYRGGSWDNTARFCRVSNRDFYTQDYKSDNLGLRLVLAGNNDNRTVDSSSSTSSRQVQDINVNLSAKIYDNPSIVLNKSKSLRLISVSINNNETVLTLSCKNDVATVGMNIDRNAYLYADGVKYALTFADGIAYSPEHTFFSERTKTFKLHFKALPLNTTRFDFVENDNSDWKMYGISLRN